MADGRSPDMFAVDILKATQQRIYRTSAVQMPMGVHIGATWRIRLNRSMCGGDAAFCQITLTTCYYY